MSFLRKTVGFFFLALAMALPTTTVPVAADELGEAALQLLLRAANSGPESGMAVLKVLEGANLPSVSSRRAKSESPELESALAGGFCGFSADGTPAYFGAESRSAQ